MLFRASYLSFRAGLYFSAKPLSPKDIKSESNKEELNQNKLAIYGLIIFLSC